jgi:subfamily B ATP-binding cassette protein MsbA
MKTYLKLLAYAGRIRQFLIPFIFTSLIASVFGILNLVLLKPLLEILFDQVGADVLAEMAVKPTSWNPLDYFQYYFALIIETEGKLSGLQFVCIIIIVSIFIANIFRYASLRLLEGFKVNMVSNLRKEIFSKSINLHLGFFNDERKGNLISHIITDVQEVENSIANTFSAAIKELLLLIGYIVTLFAISVKLTFFALIVIPITGTFLGLTLKRLKRDASDSQTRLSNIMSIMDEGFGGMRVVKAFVAEKFISNKFNTENQAYKKSTFSYATQRELASPFSEVVGVTMVASLLLFGGSLILSQNSDLSASLFIAYIALFSQVVRPAKTIAQAFSTSQRGIASGERVLRIIEMQPDIQDAQSATEIQEFSEKLSFKNVSFAYNADTPVLKNINFEITKGKTVALVGPSGGGKSTIADLIPRFYDPTDGQILLDGIDIKTISQESLRKQMGVVTQEAILFNDTILNNIAFGSEVTKEDVIAAAKIANAHDFIMQQPNGYETSIGDRGGKLSGGQRQRISIARAILKNPPILLLDEATSALDTESEKLVQDALFKLMKNRTSLVIAHRLSTIQNADEILVIKNGEIAERGTHQSLYEVKSGIYRNLVQLQEV